MEVYNIEVPKKEIKISRSQKVNGDIVMYGADNHYPSRMQALIEQSQTASACANVYSKFIATSFVNENVGKTVIGHTVTGKRYTLNTLVKEIANSISKFNGAYILVNKNLLGEVVSAEVLDFAKVRFSAFDDLGRSNYAYVGDWNDEIINFGKRTRKRFEKYPLFNNNFEIYKKMAKSTGTTASIYHIFLDEQYVYPASVFEQVSYDMGTEFEIQCNRYEEITQGSPSKLIIHTDIAGSDEEKMEQVEEITNFAGSKGSRCLIIRTQFDEQGQPISNGGYQLDAIPDTRDLSKFSEAEKACANNIRKSIGIQSILIDSENATGVEVSAAQMKMATYLFDMQVKDVRDIISESLSEIFEKSDIKFESKDFALSSKTFKDYEE